MGALTALKKQLIGHEGLELKAYRCPAGKVTIGVGRNLDDVGISGAEALALLENDIQIHMVELIHAGIGFGAMSVARQNALIDMHFNLGHTRFMQFRNMIAALAAEDFEGAADEMLDSRWARQVGQRAETLARQIRTGRP